MKKSDYVKQIEDANAELQRKLEEQGDIMDSLSAAFAQTRNEMKHSRLVVVCSDENDAINSGVGRGKIGSLVYNVNLMVIPAPQEEKQKVRDSYHLKNEILLFKSIKDRNNKQGSIYDIDMLNDYAKGKPVNPYVI